MSIIQKLPAHGRVECTNCFKACSQVEFDKTKREDGAWRITANPLAWGSVAPEVIVLGFSKGPTQAGALNGTPHDEIAYKGSRGNVGKILKHVGLLKSRTDEDLGEVVTDCRTRCHVNPDQRPYAGAESPVCRIPCRRRHNRDSATQAASAPVTVVGISASQKEEPSKFPYLPLERLNVTLKTCQKL